jgi:hypothetical protein
MARTERIISIFLILFICFLVTVRVLAGSPANPLEAQHLEPNSPLGTSFTYQGFLKDSGGTPVSKTCDFRFGLWDALTDGSQIGVDDEVGGVLVSAGYFTALVNEVNEFTSAAFNGESRWLKVEVKCGSEIDYTVLSPRQPLNATPYTFSFTPGATVQGARSDWMLKLNNTPDNGGTPYGLHVSAPYTALYGIATRTSGSTNGVYGSASSTQGVGVYGTAPVKGVEGLASSEDGIGYGVFGSSNSIYDGRGVYGESPKYGVFGLSTGYGYGVRGEVSLYPGIGVSGYNSAGGGETKGVEGWVDSPAGMGVYGMASSDSGTSYGVYGLSQSPSGYGVYGTSNGTGVYGTAPITGTVGIASSTSDPITFGVYGQVSSSQGRGVYGYHASTIGNGAGVYGRSDSTNGRGVYGWANAYSGAPFGVVGETNAPGYQEGINTYYSAGVKGFSTSGPNSVGVYGLNSSTLGGYGIYGTATKTTGWTAGILGETASEAGAGVVGYANPVNGTNYGVYGQTMSPSGYGVYGVNANGGVSVYSDGPFKSSAESVLVLSPHDIRIRDSVGFGLNAVESGGMQITMVSNDEGFVTLPVPTFGRLFGSTLYIKSLEVCYMVTWDDRYLFGTKILSTAVIKNNNGTGYTLYIEDWTDRGSTSRTCYTLNDSTPYLAIDNSTWVQFKLRFADYNPITIYTVKLTLTESAY